MSAGEERMPTKRLKEYLDQEGVRYVTITHSPAFTAPEIAHSVHVPGRALAKTVVVKLDDELALAVLPSHSTVNLAQLRREAGASSVELAEESDFRDRFPGCEVGAMPPFGNLYDMKVYVADELEENDEIVFNAGSHTEVMRLAYSDFSRLVRPHVLHFSRQPA
jgi:Ala-tRNA(Pro) deacylase